MKMKSLKTQFIGAIAMVLVAAIAMGSSTFAWFTMNREVKATGMQVKAVAGSSLQISGTTSFVTGVTTATLGDNAYRLQHAVADADLASPTGSTSKIATVSNSQDVSPETGYAKEGATLLYQKAETEATPTAAGYYKDYVCYIAAEGSNEPINAGKLKLTIDAVTGITENALNATRVMVIYGGAVKGIITLKDGNAANPLVIINDLSSDAIPSAENGTRTEASAKEITMRVFIDGTMEDTAAAGKTFVRTSAIDNLTTSSISFDAKFEVTAS